MNRYVIGIDTGGTFTDGVVMDYSTRRVIKTAKTLTTHNDLKKGVIRVLEKLQVSSSDNIRLVGISSTLATNSVAEGKTGKTALLLIGYDRKLISNYDMEDELASSKTAYFSGGHNAQGDLLEPLDREGIKEWIKKNGPGVEAVAVSSYFSPLNPSHELEALEIIKEVSDLPVVMGHQLSGKLNSIRRAATASINASLVAVMQDFIRSVRQSLSQLGIKAPLMIVRGDGTLMPYKEAEHKPVETVLSGPAASAIGARFMMRKNTSLVVDMGGTTTDIALIENGKVSVSEEGALVGGARTAVEAAQIRTVSLGCDSRIWFDNKNRICIGPQRVRALSQVARHYEKVASDFENFRQDPKKVKSIYDLEYWHLYREPDNHVIELLNDKQQRLLEKMNKPVRLSEIMNDERVFHPSHLNLNNLLRGGYIECSFLNPTDLLHVSGRLSLWEREPAETALLCLCNLYGMEKRDFIESVFRKIEDSIVEEIIIFLAQHNMKSDMPGRVDGKWGKWMLKEFLDPQSDLVSVEINSLIPLIGTGAPSRHFLGNVARRLNSRYITPEYADVANAVGAVSGFVSEMSEALVFVRENKEKFTYIVKCNGEINSFDTHEEACDYAQMISQKLAREAAIASGSSEPYVESGRTVEGSLTRFTARAMGNPRLSEKNNG